MSDSNNEKKKDKVYTEYTEDGLYVTEDTAPEEILEFVRRRTENPLQVDGKIVWNYSTHEVSEENLNISDKNSDEFVIPFQVTGTWPVMFSLLPERIRQAEILVWRTDIGEYYAYKNFYRIIPDERRQQFKVSLGQLVADHLEE